MKIGRIQALIFLSLMGGMFSPNQALGKWDLSDDQFQEPECLNCCASQKFQNQCDSQANASHLKNFIAFRSVYAIASAIGLLPIIKRPEFTVGTVAALAFLTPLFLKNFKHLVSTIWNNRLQETAEKPQGIILVVHAKSDWNFSLSSLYLTQLKKNYLVLDYTAEYISDIEDAIKSVQSRFKLPIKSLIWAAHGGIFLGNYGSETEIFFGAESINSSNIQKLMHIFAMLDKECVITIASCLSAWGENSEVLSQGNIAQLIASVAGGRKVYASRDFSTPFLEVDANTLVPRFNSLFSIPLSVVELLSFFMIDVEKTFDLRRCYFSGSDDKVQRC